MESILIETEHRICQGHTDKEIIERFGIKERTFYYYKEKLYQHQRIYKHRRLEECAAALVILIICLMA